MKVERITLNDIFYLFVIAIVIIPGFITVYTPIYRIGLLIQCIVAILGMIWMLLKCDFRQHLYYWLIVLFYGMQVLSTLIKNTEYFAVGLREVLCSIGIVSIVYIFVIQHNKRALKNLSRLFVLYILLGFVQIAFAKNIFPQTIGRITQNIYFLGVQNQIAQQLVPMLGFVVVFSFLKKSKRSIGIFILMILSILTEGISGSSTGLLATILLFILYLLYNTWIEKKLSVANVSIGYVGINLIFIFVQSVISIPFIANFIQNVLKKDITFSNRTVIWSKALLNFVSSPFWGMGRQEGKSVMTFYAINQWDVDTSYSAHNVLIQTLVESGIIGIIPIIVLFVVVARKYRCIYDDRMRIVLISVMAIMFTFLTEAYDLTYLFVFLGLICNFIDLDYTLKQS